MTMKKKDIIEGKIIKTEFPNKGTFICEDQKVTVKGVIDGQTIKGQVTKKRKSGCVVRLLDVLEKSPLEDAKPVCPHFGICGGCFYQTVSYEIVDSQDGKSQTALIQRHMTLTEAKNLQMKQ